MHCYYSLTGINYKNGYITCCPRQADVLSLVSQEYVPSKFFNNEKYKNLRKKIINDEWPAGCDTCENMEKFGNKSMRQDYILGADNKFYDNKREALFLIDNEKTIILDNLNHDYSINTDGIRHIELRFSDSCNFSCLHCSDVFSSKWKKIVSEYTPDFFDKTHDIAQLLGTVHKKEEKDLSINLSMNQIKEITDDLKKNFKSIKQINISGGEPLMQKQFWYCLEQLQDHCNIGNMHFTFHTNFNCDFDIERLNDLLKKFYGSTVVISVDGSENTYDYFRHGGKWKKLVKNIEIFKRNNLRTQKYLTCTTSAFQLLDIEKIFENFLDLDMKIETSIVQTPNYLDPSVLRHDLYEEICDDFVLSKELIKNHRNKKRIENALFNLDKIKKYFIHNKINYRYYNSFLHYIKKIDLILKQNFNDYYDKYKLIDENLIKK